MIVMHAITRTLLKCTMRNIKRGIQKAGWNCELRIEVLRVDPVFICVLFNTLGSLAFINVFVSLLSKDCFQTQE